MIQTRNQLFTFFSDSMIQTRNRGASSNIHLVSGDSTTTTKSTTSTRAGR